MTTVMACIDGSASATAVCDCAAWASERLSAPLTLLHVLDHGQYPVPQDLSGHIGLGSREHLFVELAELDAKRSKVALEQGRLMLDAAKSRVLAAGASDPELRQRHGDLLECLQELEPTTRLLVMGRQGEAGGSRQVGSHLENVIRTVHRPILVTTEQFKVPRSLMFAYDGSATARKGVQMLADSPLFSGLPVVHLVMVGDGVDTAEQLAWGAQILQQAGFQVRTAMRSGAVEPALHAYQAEQDIDLLVMGAYGHSRIRQFFVGSTTSAMLRTTKSALLLLR